MFKKTDKSKNNNNRSGAPLIAASVFLAGLAIAAAVLIKDRNVLGTAVVDNSNLVGGAAEKAEELVTVKDSGSPSLGMADAPVVIYEISDFTCPYCAAVYNSREDVVEALKSRDPSWQAPMATVRERYIDSGQVRLVFKTIPGHGQPALKAGEAALCANDQAKFWEYHDLLFENQADWYNESSDEESLADDFKGFAKELGLDQEQFGDCFDKDTHGKDIMQNYSDSQNLFEQLKNAGKLLENQAGLGTPTYIINGQYFAGAQSFAKFEEIIEKELAK